MKTIHQFGDSYGSTLYGYNDSYITKNFIELSSVYLNYEYTNNSVGGASNEIILNILLNNMNKIKKDDIIFINFSFFSRGCWYDDKNKKIKSTNVLYNDIINTKKYHLTKNKCVINLIEYYLNESKDYNMRIFELINSTLTYLQSKGVSIFYIFAEETEWSDELLNVGTNIKFPSGFAKWLQKNDLHLEEEGHYKKGIQQYFSKTLLIKTNNFTKNCKTIYVDISDIDFNSPLAITLKNKIL